MKQNISETFCTEEAMWEEFLTAWWFEYGDKPVRTFRLVKLCEKDKLMMPVLGNGNERSRCVRLGLALKNSCNMAFGSRRILLGGRDDRSRRVVYRLAKHDEQQNSRNETNMNVAMRKNRKLTRSALWKKFLEDFRATMGSEAIVSARSSSVGWRLGDDLNQLGLRYWLWPDASSPKAPPITRISLNYCLKPLPKSLIKKLGFNFDPYFGLYESTKELRLEWTVYGEELLDFSTWLPMWIGGKIDPDVLIPSPPHPSHVWGGDLRDTNYAWTKRAWNANSKWNK